MRYLRLVISCLILAAGSTGLLAGTIPYSSVGTIAPTSSITATVTGEVLGYYVASVAGYIDFVRMVDLTSGLTSAWVFDNKTTAAGTSYDFGSVTAGDHLSFEILNGVGLVFSSDPADSFDGVNHAYLTSFAGGTIPGSGSTIFSAGTFISLEDLPNGISDFNYNDDDFVFDNLSVVTPPTPGVPSPVPEPGSFVLLGTGALSVAGAVRRRLTHR